MSRFDGWDGDLSVEGDVTSALLGADWRHGALTAGLVAAHSEGDGAYRASSSNGEVSASLTGFYPWGRYAPSERLSLWGVAGYGRGTQRLKPEERPAVRTDLDLLMAAAGLRGTLAAAPRTGGFGLALKTDAFLVRTTSDKAEGVAAVRADANRLRLLLEASRPFSLDRVVLIPRVELGLRLDGGDAESGTGVEVGAGMGYSGERVTVEGSVRGTVAHEDSGYEKWGASLSVRVDPGPGGRGLSLTLTPSIGDAASGTDRLWSQTDRGTLAPDGALDAGVGRRGRLEAEVGYGFGAPRGLGVVTPYAGLGLAGQRSWKARRALEGEPEHEPELRRHAPRGGGRAGTRTGATGTATLVAERAGRRPAARLPGSRRGWRSGR